MDFEISLMDLCDALGGMYNAVEFLIYISKNHQSEIYQAGRLASPKSKKIFKHCRYNDDEGIDASSSAYTYGYLKGRSKDYYKIKFFDVDDDIFANIMFEFKKKKKEKERKREELRLKMSDVDPYGEEEWMEEKLITKFKVFEKQI